MSLISDPPSEKSALSGHFLLDAITDAIVSTDLNYRIKSWNKAAEELFGHPASEVLNREASSVLNYSFLTDTREIAYEQLKTEGRWKGEVVYRNKEGRLLCLSISSTWMRDQDDRLVGYASIYRDNTDMYQMKEEHYRVTERVSTAEKIFRSFMENTPTLTWILDDKGCYRYMNSFYSRAFGIPLENIGRSVYEFFPAELCDSYIEANEQVWKANAPMEFMEKGITSDGAAVILQVFKFPLGVENGTRLLGGTALDITQMVRTREEEENKKMEFIKAIMEAQEKERKEISFELHDNVNQILTTCKLFLEIARNNPADARFIDACYANIQNVIQEIRSISHNLTPYTLKDLGLLAAIHDLAGKINQSGKLSIRIQNTGTLEEERISPDIKLALFRIVQEKISNVLKHAQATEMTISFTTPEGRICLDLVDNGRGFDEKVVKKGLGLNNIHNRVEYYKGTMQLKTAPGEGCQLRVELPCT